jgi:LacI family transcriptional regulator
LSRQHRTTIKEIAAMCGVSTQTVSRVINHRPDVSPKTRAAVEAAIAAVGFQPSAVARSLVQRRSSTIGVIVAGLRYFGVSQTLNGITDASEESGFALFLKELQSYDRAEIVRAVEVLLAHRVEGIIFVAPELGENIATLIDQLPSSSPPFVFLKAEPSPLFSSIVIDNKGGARLAVEHLLSLGRRTIGHVAGPLAWREARARHDGWLETLQRARLEPGPVIQGSWTAESGDSAFEQMIAIEPALDAIFVGNDQMALGVLYAAHRRGIAIPDDIAVVGFDGLVEGAQFIPSLTTINQPLTELGHLALRELLALVEAEPGQAVIRSTILATELIVRDSAPAAPGPAVSAGPPIRVAATARRAQPR